MSEFKIPPISTLIGSNTKNYFKVIKSGGHIDKEFYLKYLLSTLGVCITSPFRVYEEMYFKNKIKNYKFKKETLFILGHWRSGTTFLHNLLCVDPDSGYLNTYHSVFPNNLASGFIFKNFMRYSMPTKRPTDNVKLGVDLPQEDEFAIGNINERSLYNFFYFPEHYQSYFKQSILDVNDNIDSEWDNQYKKLIIKALINTKGKRAIIKNPVNTARVKSILRIFPYAKFLFIYRNPITVFRSTQKFFYALYPTLWFHKVDNKFIDEMIYFNYKKLLDIYFEQKKLIPTENLLEIKFEEFEKNPLDHCNNIYTNLLNVDFDTVSGHFKNSP